MRILTVAFLLASCGPLFAQDQGTIVFYREPHAMTGYFKPGVFCDGEGLAEIENGTYFQVTAPTGSHNCAAESSQGPTIEVNVAAGRATYVHVKQVSGWHDHAVLVNTSEDEYNKEKNRLKPLREWKRDTLIPQSPSADAGQAPLTEALSSTPAPQRSTKSKPERIFSSCLIVNARPTRADESAWVALAGKDPTDFRYDYIDSLHLPSDHLLTFRRTDLDKLESKGARVIVLDRYYTAEHLAAARENCKAIDAR